MRLLQRVYAGGNTPSKVNPTEVLERRRVTNVVVVVA